uniref:Cathepsin H n=1 Tax=Pygocentrus nattereri TaxID=42514 RepID=A0AAR2IW92_PYGNA
MKALALTVSLLVFLYCVCATPLVTEKDEFGFKTWMSEHNRRYSVDEYYQRLQIFTENKRRVDQHNAGNHKFRMGLNQFADMTFAEFKKKYLLTEPQNCSATKGNHVSSNGPYPDSIDWRKKGNYVTHVKNQGSCGSCWTFSTTGCLESVTAIATGKLLLLVSTFEYIKYSKGIMTEDDYPYTARDGPCKYNPQHAAAFVRDVVNITLYDEMGMVDAVARFNPVSFAYEVTNDFMFYTGGVYSSTKCHNTTDKVNHAVLAVGYAEENDTPYWIVKNSWGTSWGIDGYVCLIHQNSSYAGLRWAKYKFPCEYSFNHL